MDRGQRRYTAIKTAVLIVSCCGVLLFVERSARGAIVTSGDLSPVHDGSDPWSVAGELRVGNSGAGMLSIEAGSAVNVSQAVLGFVAGSTGTAVVTGGGSQLNVSGQLEVGRDGVGTLTVIDRGLVMSDRGLMAGTASAGLTSATISGFGSRWSIANDLRVGRSSELTLQSGGWVISDASVVGHEGAGFVTVTGGGSWWRNGDLTMRGNGSAVNVEAGAVATHSDVFVGYGIGDVAAITVTGAGSALSSDGSLHVGSSGQGTLNIDAGGLVTVEDHTWVGFESGAAGSIQFAGGRLTTGGLMASATELQGVGTIETKTLVADFDVVFDSASGLQPQVIVSGLPGQNITIDIDASGSANTTAMGAGYRGAGTMTVRDGLTISSGTGYVGYHAGAAGTMLVTGGGTGWNIDGDLNVGKGGSGELTIAAGATAIADFGYVGDAAGANGELTLTGSGSRLNLNNQLFVGDEGGGAMTIADGGTFVGRQTFVGFDGGSSGALTVAGSGSSFAAAGEIRIGESGEGTLEVTDGGMATGWDVHLGVDAGASGQATLSGAGSQLQVRTFRLGDSGTGVLNVNAGATVVSRASYLGDEAAGLGRATVDGAGAVWTCSEQVYVGHKGAGELTISGGGAVNDAGGYIGYGAGSMGTAMVTGADSRWNHAGNFYAGFQGDATLAIDDGGSVTSGRLFVGFLAGSSGDVTISSAGSRLSSNFEMHVGFAGQGALTIEGGGIVAPGGQLSIARLSGSDGVVNLNGGVLNMNANPIVVGDGNGVLNFNGGRLEGATQIILGGMFDQQGGTLAPGTSAGTTVVGGDYQQRAAATLEIEWQGLGGPGSDHDLLVVDGAATIGGGLDLLLGPSFTPALGDAATIVTANSLSGRFATVTNVVQPGGLGLAVRYGNEANTIDVRVSKVGDVDFDDDVDTHDVMTAVQGFTGAEDSGNAWIDGDFDGDGDTDTGDLTTAIANFMGASAANPNVPDLVYDPLTGNVTIDADGANVISFSLQSGPFNAADFSGLPAGLTDNIASQIGWTSFNLFSGLTGTANLGAILPAGLNQSALEAALTTASYGLALGGGGGGGRLDIVIPEPGSIALVGLGAMVFVHRRRAA